MPCRRRLKIPNGEGWVGKRRDNATTLLGDFSSCRQATLIKNRFGWISNCKDVYLHLSRG
jgi:hypothetical protein